MAARESFVALRCEAQNFRVFSGVAPKRISPARWLRARSKMIDAAAGVAIIGGVLVVLQLVPYGRNHLNPPVIAEPSWSDPAARALAVRACYDCHSNETHWPWYSNIAPVSWLVQRDVDKGRQVVNFSEWNRPQEEAAESAEAVAEGEMPPALYLPLHPDARLSAAERALLIRGLPAMSPLEKISSEDD